jgi:hypothetical protein
MSLRQQLRTMATAMLIVAVALWAETGCAMICGFSEPAAACHAGSPSAAAHSVTQMGSACCPRSAAAKPECPSRSLVSLSCAGHPDCCAIGNHPARRFAYPVTSSRSIPLEMFAATASALEAFSLRSDEPSRDESPPFTKPVCDKKTDLRI